MALSMSVKCDAEGCGKSLSTRNDINDYRDLGWLIFTGEHELCICPECEELQEKVLQKRRAETFEKIRSQFYKKELDKSQLLMNIREIFVEAEEAGL